MKNTNVLENNQSELSIGSFDNTNPYNYNQNCPYYELLGQAFMAGYSTMLENKYLNLDNGIPQTELFDTPLMEGDSEMAKRIQKRVEIDGVTRWVSGVNEKDIFRNIVKLARETDIKSSSTCNQSFRDYANSWYPRYKEKDVKQHERKNYRIIFEKHLFPFFGEMRIDEITTDCIQDFYNHKVDEGYKFSSIHKMEAVLKMILHSAVEDDLIQRNPAKSKRLNYPKTESKREALSMEKLTKLIHSLQTLPNIQDRLLIAIPSFTGTRRGETLALCWEDIDWSNRLVHVRKAVTFENGRPVIGNPKTDSGIREIPLDDRLEAMLKLIKQDSGYIIGDGITPITECMFRNRWKRIEKTIDLFGITSHGLRHTYITIAQSSGIDVKTLQSIAGHADVETTLNRYTHQRKDILKDAGKKINNVFSEIA